MPIQLKWSHRANWSTRGTGTQTDSGELLRCSRSGLGSELDSALSPAPPWPRARNPAPWILFVFSLVKRASWYLPQMFILRITYNNLSKVFNNKVPGTEDYLITVDCSWAFMQLWLIFQKSKVKEVPFPQPHLWCLEERKEFLHRWEVSDRL